MRLKSQNRNAVCAAMLVMGSLTSSTLLMGQTPDESGTQAVQSQNAPTLHKFSFKHAKAADVLKIFMQLDRVSNPDEVEGFAVDERTNSIVFIAAPTEAREFESAFSLLDSESQEPIGAADRGSAVGLSTPSSPLALSRAFSFSVDFNRDEPIEKLKQAYNEAEQKAHKLANTLKQSKSISEAERSELNLLVRRSFDARQAIQRAEVVDLAHRLEKMQQAIESRSKLTDLIVERRVADLLNPDLRWEVSAASDSAAVSTKVAKETEGKAVESMMKKVQGRWIIQLLSGQDGLGDKTFSGVELRIEGETMTFATTTIDMRWIGLSKRNDASNSIFDIDFVFDPNGDQMKCPGIIFYDGDTLRICFSTEAFQHGLDRQWRPDRLMAGSKVALIHCRRAPESAAATQKRDTEVLTKQ